MIYLTSSSNITSIFQQYSQYIHKPFRKGKTKLIKPLMISFRRSIQQSFQQYIQLLQQIFIASSPNVNIQKIMKNIRAIVLRYDCIQMKDDLLKFSLMCQQSRGKKQNDQMWKKVLRKKMNYLRGLQKARIIMAKHQQKNAFKCINQKAFIFCDQSTINIKSVLFSSSNSKVVTQKSDIRHWNIKNQQSEVNLDQMPVQQDIKLKTQYFFKWCKFSKYCRSIKMLRLKEIDDLRKSLTFNHYAVKFSFFANWRKHVKKSQQQKMRFNKIKDNSKYYMFKNVINNGFYALYEFKQIQKRMDQKVKNTLQTNRIKCFYEKLITNKDRQQKKQISFEKINCKNLNSLYYGYLFTNYMSQSAKLLPIKSKTLSINRLSNQRKIQKLFKQMTFNSFKMQIQKRKSLISNVQQKIQYIQFQSLIDNLRYKQKLKKKVQELQIQRQFKSMQKFINTLKSNKIFGLRFKQIQRYEQTSSNQIVQSEQAQLLKQGQLFISKKLIKNHQDLYDFLAFQQSQRKFGKYLQKKIKQTFIHKLRYMNNNIKQKSSFNQNICNFRQQKFIQYLLKNINSVKQSIKLNDRMKQFYNKKLVKNSFFGIKSYKEIKLSQEQCLDGVFQLLLKSKQRIAFYQIQRKSQNIKKCEILKDKLQRFMTKKVWNKMFSISIKINERMLLKQKILKQSRMRYLFNLFVQNKNNMSNLSQIVLKTTTDISRKFLLSKLKQNKILNNYVSDIKQIKEYNNKVFFLKQLRNRFDSQCKYQQQIIKLQKTLGFFMFRHKLVRLQQIQVERNNQKSKLTNIRKKIALQQVKNIFNIKKLKNIQLKSNYLQLIQRNNQNTNSYIRDCFNYQLAHIKSKIEKNTATIINSLKKSVIQKIEFAYKESYLNRWLDWNQKTNVIEKLYSNLQLKQKQLIFKGNLSKIRNQAFINHFKTYVQSQKTQMMQKQTQLIQILQIKMKKQFIERIKYCKVISQNEQQQNKLRTIILKRRFSLFARNCLIEKYEQIKKFCAVKQYAKKLKQKGMRGMRILLLRVQNKQNKVVTQQIVAMKVDRALHQKRKSNKLSETVERYNHSRSLAKSKIFTKIY